MENTKTHYEVVVITFFGTTKGKFHYKLNNVQYISQYSQSTFKLFLLFTCNAGVNGSMFYIIISVNIQKPNNKNFCYEKTLLFYSHASFTSSTIELNGSLGLLITTIIFAFSPFGLSYNTDLDLVGSRDSIIRMKGSSKNMNDFIFCSSYSRNIFYVTCV